MFDELAVKVSETVSPEPSVAVLGDEPSLVACCWTCGSVSCMLATVMVEPTFASSVVRVVLISSGFAS